MATELPGIPAYHEIEAPHLKEIEKALSLLAIPREKAICAGPEQILAHYGIDLFHVQELRFLRELH